MARRETREREAVYFVRQAAKVLKKALDDAAELGLHVECVVRHYDPPTADLVGGGRHKGSGTRTFEVDCVVRKDV